MLNYLKNEANITLTENGAAAYTSSLSCCVDLFASIGTVRDADEKDIVNRFIRAYTENSSLAMKILFFGRDVRGGLGERRAFRVIINWLADNRPEEIRKNIAYIAEYGRFDDLTALIGTACEKDAALLIRRQLKADLNPNAQASLLAKWLPSVNTSSEKTVQYAKRLARLLNMTDKQYRQTLSALRKKINILENNLREKDYSFDYSKQPSCAMMKYRSAFYRNDSERYISFLNAVNTGKKKLHTDAVAPYEIVRAGLKDLGCISGQRMTADERMSLNVSWNALPNFCDGRNALAVVDTSGSMYSNFYGLPAAVALSLGMYFAEHNTGTFHNCFIEFSSFPKLIEIKGETFMERLEYISSFNKIANTDIDAVFKLILSAAVRNKVPVEEMPETLYIISDMEFDCCVNNASMTNFNNAKYYYEQNGYKLPQIVFWNVASRNNIQPVCKNDRGAALVSGCTPRLFSLVANGIISPYSVMMDILNADRYSKITAYCNQI